MPNITVRVSEEEREQFEAVCKELGLTVTTAIQVFMKTFARSKGFPFPVTVYDIPAHKIAGVIAAIAQDKEKADESK